MQSTEVRPVSSEPPSTHIDRKAVLDKPDTFAGKNIKIDIPLDIVVSLLRPDELAKLRKYIASYLGKY